MKFTVWTTKEGVALEIDKMATPHLLATIHMIERTRMNNLLSVAMAQNWSEEILEYYGRFAPEYEALCDEAERRHLIRRGTQKPGLVTRRKRNA